MTDVLNLFVAEVDKKPARDRRAAERTSLCMQGLNHSVLFPR